MAHGDLCKNQLRKWIGAAGDRHAIIYLIFHFSANLRQEVIQFH